MLSTYPVELISRLRLQVGSISDHQAASLGFPDLKGLNIRVNKASNIHTNQNPLTCKCSFQFVFFNFHEAPAIYITLLHLYKFEERL